MLNRWIQENDFKYMIRHFGINQITSYKSRSYQSIEELLAEKEVFSEIWQTLSKNAEQHVDKAAKLIGQGKERLDTDKKVHYDALRITAGNIFYISCLMK